MDLDLEQMQNIFDAADKAADGEKSSGDDTLMAYRPSTGEAALVDSVMALDTVEIFQPHLGFNPAAAAHNLSY